MGLFARLAPFGACINATFGAFLSVRLRVLGPLRGHCAPFGAPIVGRLRVLLSPAVRVLLVIGFSAAPTPESALRYIDLRGVKPVLKVSRIELLDHFDAGAAIIGDLIDIGPLHQAKTNIGVPQTVGRAGLAVPVFFQAKLTKEGIEQLP